MDTTCNSSGDSSSASSTASFDGNRDHYLRQLNKLSHKISKPTTTVKRPGFDPYPNPSTQLQAPPPLPPNPPASNQGNLHQHQPPVYNINKSDFRDVVQRLTGSPAHERVSAPPPPIHHSKPQSSRLQRIRPPPLAHVRNRPPPLLNGALLNPNPPAIPVTGATGFIPRPPTAAPLSPLPPLPPVHAAAESPVSAYMRYLHDSISAVDSNPKQFSGFSTLAPLVSPRWCHQQENAPPLQNILPPPANAPTSASVSAPPPPFGCMSSPKSPYALLSPSIMLSPASGEVGFPMSPTRVAIASPKFKGH